LGRLGDPLVEECSLPPGLIYIIPTEASLALTKPLQTSAEFIFLNGGNVQLAWYINETSNTTASAGFTPPHHTAGRYFWEPKVGCTCHALGDNRSVCCVLNSQPQVALAPGRNPVPSLLSLVT
jgi:hypothetical protein